MHSDRTPPPLIVEDNQDACDIYSAFLTGAGFNVLVAHSARAAFHAAVEHRPDVSSPTCAYRVGWTASC